jgi:hypothetical protein
MGGFGSGFRAGYRYRPVVEEALKVSAGECARTIPIAHRAAGAAFTVGVLIDGSRFEVVLELVPAGLFPIPCWRCPRCQTRRHTLYRHPAGEGLLLCRCCHNLSYLSHRDRGRTANYPDRSSGRRAGSETSAPRASLSALAAVAFLARSS